MMILVVKGLVVWLDQPVQEVVDPQVEVIVDPVMTGDFLREIIFRAKNDNFSGGHMNNHPGQEQVPMTPLSTNFNTNIGSQNPRL